MILKNIRTLANFFIITGLVLKFIFKFCRKPFVGISRGIYRYWMFIMQLEAFLPENNVLEWLDNNEKVGNLLKLVNLLNLFFK